MIRALAMLAALTAGGVSLEPPSDGLEFEGQGRTCIAWAVFAEARGEPVAGQVAVAEVIRNRMLAIGWDADPCAVVQAADQFHGIRDWPPGVFPWAVDAEAWSVALQVTDGVMLHGWTSGCDGATHFFSGPTPVWARDMRVVCAVANHTMIADAAP